MRVLACLLAVLVGIQAVEQLRLADGPHGCAGRLEVWYSGRWGTVCDDGWDLRDAAVACRELGCGGALAAPGGAFFGEGAGPVWLSELACRGSEGQLGLCPHRGWKAHICSHEEDAGVVCAGQRVANSRDESALSLEGDPWLGLSGELSPSSEEPPVTHAPRPAGNPQNGPRKKSPRPPKQAKSTRASLLMTGAPRQERLRLVSGPHGCAGRLEVWHGGRWGTVCDDGWDLRDATVACRELGCGGALAAPGGARFGPGSGPVWMDDVGCGGGEQALRDCPRSPWGRSNCDHSEDAGLVCTGMPLGYVPPTAPALDSNSSAAREAAPRPPSTTVVQTPGSAGSWPPPASPTAPLEPGPEAGSPQLRLVAGPSRCSGRLEVWHDGRWGTVCDDSWDMRDSAVVCRELGCGGPRQPDPVAGRFGWGAGPIWLDDMGCVGTEASLVDCPASAWGKHNCAHNEDVGVTCTGTPGLDTISDPFSWSWLPGLGQDQDAWLPRELVTKTSVSLSPGELQKTTTKAPGKMPKSTKKWVTKTAKRLTTQPPRMPTTKRSRDLGTTSPPEQTSHTTISRTAEASPGRTSESPKRLKTEAPRRRTSHTTAKPTLQTSQEWTSKTIATLSTQDPQETTSEVSTKQIPQASLEPPAEVPEKSPESSTDPASSHTSGVPGYTDNDDYPPWIWDPTSGEDLGIGSTTPRPGCTLSWGTTQRPGGPFPAARHFLHTGDQDGSQPLWTQDTPSGSSLAKGTPITTKPGPILTSGTTRRPGHLTPAPRAHGNTGSPRKPWPGHRLLRPTAGRITPTSSSTPSSSLGPSGPQLTSDSWPQLIFDSTSKQSVTTDPPDTSPPTPSLPSLTSPNLALSTPDSTVAPALAPERSSTPSFLPKKLTSDPSAPSEVTSLFPTSELTPEPDTTPDLDVTPSPNTVPEASGSPDLSTSPTPTTFTHPTMTPYPTTISHPTTIPDPTIILYSTTTTTQPTTTHPTTIPHPTMTPQLTTTPHSTMTPQHTTTPHPTITPQPPTTTHPTMIPGPTSTHIITTKSLSTSLGTELPSATPPPRVKSRLHPQLTSMESPPSSTSQMLNLEPSAASESSPSRPSPAPSMPSIEDFKLPRSQSPELSYPPTHTPHSTSDPSVTPDFHLSSIAHPLDQPPPDQLTVEPTLSQSPGPLGPCVSPTPPVRVMACEPPALVELVAAVREVGGQLQRLTKVLEQDRQERQALGLGMVQLVEAAQGLGQLGETVKRLAEVTWPPSMPAPTTTTPEEEERPLRGDV